MPPAGRICAACSVRRAASWGRCFVIAIPALLLPFVIRAAVVEGVATATEVSTIGVAYTVVVGLLVYREFDWRRVYPMLVETATLSGAILLIIGGATAMAWALTQSGFSTALAASMSHLPGGQWSFPRHLHRGLRRFGAACWKAFRPWCSSARCSSPWPRNWA